MAENKFDLNPAQEDAIQFTHEQPAIVAAAAGSGKTTLLVQRVVRLLSDVSLDIPADSLAIMTFTRNATKSMREKLSKELTKQLEALADSTDGKDRERYDYLKKQIFLLRQAAISTIDAFCLRMIKENAEAFDLPLNFTLADDAKKAAMQTQAMRAALEELYGDKFTDAERDALFFSFSFEDDYALEKALLSVAEKLSCFPDPEKWISDTLDAYKDINSLEDNFLGLLDNILELNVRRAELCAAKYSGEAIYDSLFGEVSEKRANTKGKNKALDDMENTVLPAIERYIVFDEKRIAALLSDYNAYKRGKSIISLGELMANLENNSENPPELFPRKGNNYEYKMLFNKVSKEIAETVKALIGLKVDFEAEQRELGFMQNALRTFFKLLNIFREFYALEKHAAGCVEFSDCERELYNKLSENGGDNDFRRQLSQRFKCVIVDEFQDSNNIQAEIFRLLGEERLFYVGDVKQSIYSFRGADPYIMAGLCDSKDSGFKKLPLNTNYRSRKAVIDTVNAAFNGLMTTRFGGVDYADGNGLNLGANFPETPNSGLYDSEIALIATPKQNDDEKDKEMTLARYTAKRIRELIDNKDFLICDGEDENNNPMLRRAEFSDFIILLRTKTKLECYRKALSELGIPSSAPSGSGFFKADEIILARNYLKIIDDPLLNEELLKVLMSPIYRFTTEETALIRMGLLGLEEPNEAKRRKIADSYRRRSLYSCVKDCMTQTARLGDEKIAVRRNISPKLERFANDLKAFRYHMSSSSLVDLVRKIYEDTDLISVVAAFEDSAGRVGNIRRLQKLAADFEARGGGGLGDFLRFLDRASENASNKIEEAERPEGGANSVRIMTFHASKGLEAPVCIMSELQGTMRPDDYSGNLLLSYEHFMAMTHTDIKRRKKTKMLAYRALSRFIRERQLGDELRLLYVAMTRAREKLIMVSGIGQTNFKEFNKLVNSDSIDPELHDAVYEESSPFKCVFNSLLQYAPLIDGETKEFSLDNIGCKIAAVDPGEKTDDDDPAPLSEDSTADEAAYAVSEEEIAALSARINGKYAHPEDTVQQAKFTTTELAHKKSAKPISLTKPVFASGGVISGVEKGNAYHHCMQHFPLAAVNAEMNQKALVNAVRAALDEMEKHKKITADELKIVEAERIAAFFGSGLGKRMLRAFANDPENVKREQSFYAEVNGGEVRQDYGGDISIQGQIDVYFIEDGDIVVVDYKSDTVENLAKEQSSYEFQVEIYTKILGKLTGMNVKEMYLYAFLADSEYRIGK